MAYWFIFKRNQLYCVERSLGFSARHGRQAGARVRQRLISREILRAFHQPLNRGHSCTQLLIQPVNKGWGFMRVCPAARARLLGRKSDYAFTNLSILGIWHTVHAQDRNERFSNFRIADDSGRVVNFIKHKVLILILPM